MVDGNGLLKFIVRLVVVVLEYLVYGGYEGNFVKVSDLFKERGEKNYKDFFII